ncbi:MAG: DUF4056 domain-containing protein [Sedimentisphaerales bacterium]|nr:DUF4056 domain-containing protein [Sedimentisphaerales bacterium]
MIAGKRFEFLRAANLAPKDISGRKANCRISAARLSFTILITAAIFFIDGCNSCQRPRLRLGAYFGAPVGIAYPDPEHLGRHGYTKWWSEKIGLVYTCKGGFVDIGHLRDSADRTSYCALITYENLLKEKTELSFQLLEPSRHIVTIEYPDSWHEQPNKEEIAHEIAIGLGQYLAYNTMVWHEIITWYGYKYTGVFSEYISAFSWEDIYSDVVGTHVAVKVLNNGGDNYDKKMTEFIYKELQSLDVQPISTAKKAEKLVKGKWFEGDIYPFVHLKKRNFDTGCDDGFVTPWLVPGICGNSQPLSYPVPNIDFLQKYGFSVKVEIEPKIMESHKILKLVYPDGDGKNIIPSEHFPIIMKYITEEEIKKFGREVNVPNL